MTPWVARFSLRMFGILLGMLLTELLSYWLAFEYGVNRLVWVPLSFALVALAGYETVRRLPLVWGALIGGVLAGITNLLSWLIGSLVQNGRLAFPDEAPPLLLVTSLLMTTIIGSIVGVVSGMVARGRRRHRARRSAIKKLAYTAYDDATAREADVSQAPAPAPSARGERTLERPVERTAEQR
ncbi:MAG TPA: hypothetical protein VE861_01845 [Gemmatimonadaceae bacterium]|nr:hypothetical protein [Gemmatimonadaceae bacterium]